MIDSVGNISGLLALGPNNPLALATIDRLAGPRLKQAVLLDFDAVRLSRAAERVSQFGVPDVITELYHPDDAPPQVELVSTAFDRRDIDVVLIAATPTTKVSSDQVPTAAEVCETIRTSLIDSMTIAEAALDQLIAQGHGILVVFSHSGLANSLGLDRAYCAAMAGLGTLTSTLAQRAEGTGVRVISVRITPVADPNASGEAHSSAWVRPVDVASAVGAEVRTTRRNIRNATLTLPKSWRRMMPSQRN